MSPFPRTRSSVPLDDQSALPSLAGVPGWAAVAIAACAAFLGVLVDGLITGSELTLRFSVIYVLGCTVAALLVRHRSLFTAVVQPPIILFIAVPSAYIALNGGSLSLKGMLLNVIPLVNRFPLMLFATTVVMMIGAVRLWQNRPRQTQRTPEGKRTAEAKRTPETKQTRTARKRIDVTPDTAARESALAAAETERISVPTAAARRSSDTRGGRVPGARTRGRLPAESDTPDEAARGLNRLSRPHREPPRSHRGSPPDASQPESGAATGLAGTSAPGSWLAMEPRVHSDDAGRLDRRSAIDESAASVPDAHHNDSPADLVGSRRTTTRTEAAGRQPVRYRPDSVTSHSSRRDANGEPVFDDSALHTARQTRSGRRFQPEARLPEHPIPSVRYRGEPRSGY